jgi:hypothetical protein
VDFLCKCMLLLYLLDQCLFHVLVLNQHVYYSPPSRGQEPWRRRLVVQADERQGIIGATMMDNAEGEKKAL